MVRRSKFTPLVERVKKKYRVRIRKWCKEKCGMSWQILYPGKVHRWVIAPYPTTEVELCIFLHEVGHHVGGFFRRKEGLIDEFKTWLWAVRCMKRLGIKPNRSVFIRIRQSMYTEIDKHTSDGMKDLPKIIKIYLFHAASLTQIAA